MKMKLLSVAIAGLSAAGAAQAVYVNPDGTGQVLLYPYYTVQNGYETYVSVVNTQNTTKAVKVRILEGMNSQEVLDFNLYLSPYDEWTAKIYKTTDGAAIMTGDTSCTSGQVTSAGVPFRNSQYATDTGEKGLDRTREGYIELIEMGNIVDPDLVAAIKHGGAIGSRVPGDCALVREEAKSTGILNDHNPAVIIAPSGGLYGYESTIAVGSGLRTTVDAVAMDAFWAPAPLGSDHHSAPGETSPSLQSVETTSLIIDHATANAALYDRITARNQRVDLVSAVLMHESVMNDYVIDSGRNSSTNWVVTFPTKRFYVDPNARTVGAVSPFAHRWDPAATRATLTGACDPITINYFDREETPNQVTEDDFSPQVTTPGLKLCKEVNTISWKRNGSDATATIYGASFTHTSVTLASGFELGWADMTFTGNVDDAGSGNDAIGAAEDPRTEDPAYTGPVEYAAVLPMAGVTLYGLPVIGFAAITSENTIDGGLSNYMGSIVHKYYTSFVANNL